MILQSMNGSCFVSIQGFRASVGRCPPSTATQPKSVGEKKTLKLLSHIVTRNCACPASCFLDHN